MRKSHFKALAARRSVTSEPAPVADSSRETADCDVRISIANSRCASPRLLRASRKLSSEVEVHVHRGSACVAP